jgi:hypothetical protein
MMVTPRAGYFISGIIATHFATSAQSSENFIPYPSNGGVVLSTGWKTAEGAKTQSVCVASAEYQDHGQTRTNSYSEVSDTSSLMDALSISAAVKLTSLGGGGSASVNFSKTVRLNNYGLNITADMRILEGAQYLIPSGKSAEDSVRLSDWAEKLARKDLHEFWNDCGDSFVSTIRKGTALFAVYTIDTSSTSETQALAANIGGQYGPFSGNVSAQSQITKLETEARVHINYFQLGGDGTPIATNDSSLRDLIQQLAKNASPHTAAPFEIGVTPYSQLPNFPRTMETKLPVGTVMANQYFRLYSLDRQASDAISDAHQVEISGNPGPLSYFFDRGVTVDSVKKAQDKIRQDMKKLQAAIGECRVKADRCKYPDDVSLDDYEYRQLLPVHNGAVRVWNDIHILRDQLSSVQKNLATTKPTLVNTSIRKDFWGRFSVSHTSSANPLYTKLKTTESSLDQQIKTLANTVDSADDRYWLWIYNASDTRCKNVGLDPDDTRLCLDNSQLDAIRDGMCQRDAGKFTARGCVITAK